MEPNIEETRQVPRPVNRPAAKEIFRWKKLIKKFEKCCRPVKKYRVVKHTELDKLFHKVNVEKSVFYYTDGRGKDIYTKAGQGSDELQNLLYDTEEKEIPLDKPHIYETPKAFNEPSFQKGAIDFSCASEIAHDTPEKLSDDPFKYYTMILDRLFVPEKQYISYKGITDVDEKYFSIVQKRCKKYKLTKQDYMNYLRESLRLRLQTGYIFDEIFKINEKAEIEETRLTHIQTKLKNYTVSFDGYLAEEHKQSMKPLLTYAEEVAITEEKSKKLKKKMYLATGIRHSIYDLEESWRKSRLCEEFLVNFFSILSQKLTPNDLKDKDENEVHNKTDEHSDDMSLASLAPYAVTAQAYNTIPEINLQNPEYLFEILTSLEHQCLDYLTFTELLEKPNMTISAHIELITKRFAHEVMNVKQTISNLSGLIQFIEINNKTLEDRVNLIIHGLFKETFAGAAETIELNEYLSQTYKTCITSASSSSLSSLQMMAGLAKEYTDILLEMDSLPTEVLKKLVKNVEIRETNRLKLAKNARRMLHELETLTDQMLQLFRPIAIKRTRKLMYRTMPPTAKEPPPPKPVEITAEEKEYLYLFTEFCPFTDDARKYLKQREQN